MKTILATLFISAFFLFGCAQKESYDKSSYKNDSATWQQFKAKNALEELEKE